MEHLLNLLCGVANVLEVAPERRQYHIERHGFANDAKRLRGDFAAVGRDLRTQLKRESSNYRPR